MTVLLTSLRISPSISKQNTFFFMFHDRVSSCPLNRQVFPQFILCSLRFCTAASQTAEVISGKIDVLVGSVTPLFTPPNQKLTNVSAPHRADGRNSPCYRIRYLMEHYRENTQSSINVQGYLSVYQDYWAFGIFSFKDFTHLNLCSVLYLY